MGLAASIGVVAAVLAQPRHAAAAARLGGRFVRALVSTITLAVYAFDVGGAAAVGLAGLIRLLPGALASPFAGLLGDRHSRRAVLLWSVLAGTLVLACSALAVALGSPAALVFALAGAYMVVSSPYVPAEGALLPAIARSPQELSAANVAHSVMDNAGFLVGSALDRDPARSHHDRGRVRGGGRQQRSRRGDAEPVEPGPSSRLRRGGGRRRREPAPRDRARRPRAVRRPEARPRRLGADPPHPLRGRRRRAGRGSRARPARPRPVGGRLPERRLGIGAIGAGAALAVLLDRGRLAAGLLAGSLIAGIATAVPGLWVVAAAAYVGLVGIGVGYTFTEVAARTLMQRLGSDETLARTFGFLETARLAAMALGSILAPALVALLGGEGALIALGCVLPAFALLRWGALRSVEIGAPVDESRYALLRAERIFAPLPVDVLEGITHGLVPVEAAPGEEIVVQGDPGEHFYLIETGTVEVFVDGRHCRTERAGESFGEIALIRDVPRTATVRAAEPTRLLALGREQFLTAVTGHRRSSEAAGEAADRRLAGEVT